MRRIYLLWLAGGCLLAPVSCPAADGHGEFISTLGPVAFWRLDDVTGRVARDSGGGHHGRVHGAVSLGLPGALKSSTDAASGFDGQSGYIRAPHSDALLLEAGAVSLWVKPRRLDRVQGLLSKDATGFGEGGHLTLSLNKSRVNARLQDKSRSFEIEGPAIPAGRWSHVGLTFGPAGMRLFVDGKLAAENSHRGGLAKRDEKWANREPLVLAASEMTSQSNNHQPLTDFFAGSLDDVAIFGQQLADRQMEQLFVAARPRYATIAEAYALNEPLAWWRLDEPLDRSIAVDRVGYQHGQYNTTGARRFDGDDYVDVGAMDAAGKQLTIVACVSVRSFRVPDARIVSKSTGANLADHYWMLSTVEHDGAIRWRFRLKTERGAQELIAHDGDIKPETPVLVAAVYDGERMMLYHNGTLVGERAHSGPVRTNSHCRVWIGDNPSGAGSRPFDGEIADVAVFDSALSPAVLKAMTAAANKEKTAPPVAQVEPQRPPPPFPVPAPVPAPAPRLAPATVPPIYTPTATYYYCVCCGQWIAVRTYCPSFWP
ncbi:MAG: LamG domain-containing protein [Pirellulaceae bacterium]|nr:LamG domain-containing protein [Pirellulaceae bacterium]MDP7014990.1 LamG domain-containing protein [Pirellulaceae bacterium]